MIVVEGFDGSGKTTLARYIATQLGWQVLHTGGPTTDREHVKDCLIRSIHRCELNCVQDRITHISEAAYSMLDYPAKAALALCAIPKMPVVTMVYCRPPIATLIDALKKHDNKDHDTPEHMVRVRTNAYATIAIYDTLMAMVAGLMPVIRYDRTEPGGMKKIDNMIRGFQ